MEPTHPQRPRLGSSQPHGSRHAAKPLLGLRQRPGRLALALFRIPLFLYKHGSGWMLGHTFLQLTHAGRRTGEPHQMVAQTASYDPATEEVVICSAWGPNSDWYRNIQARPALQVQVGRDTFVPEQHFLTDAEAFKVAVEYRERHPWRLRLEALILGWGDLSSDTAIREFVRERPFVAFRPPTPATG